MNGQGPGEIRVDTGNPIGALFGTLGRDVRELFRNPFAFFGGLGGLALTGLALFLGGEAIANAGESQCPGLTEQLDVARDAYHTAAGAELDAEVKSEDLHTRLTDIETQLAQLSSGAAVNVGTAEGVDPKIDLNNEKADLQKQLAPLDPTLPALKTKTVELRKVVDDVSAQMTEAGCEVEDDFEIDFTPGTLARLGVKMEETEIPQKVVVQETRAEDAPVEEVKQTVTTDDQAKPSEEPPPKEKPDNPAKDKPPIKDTKDKKLPTSKTPTSSNTPYKNDLPTVPQNQGDPFGDPDGWDDLTRDGDPWATEVMKVLNQLKVGAYAGKGEKGNFKFQLTICKDGTIKQVLKKGGSMSADGQSAVLLALEQATLPKPPKKVASSMPGNCAKIKYVFDWSSQKVK